MSNLPTDTTEKEKSDFNEQFKSVIIKPITSSEEERTEDLMKFIDGKSDPQLSYKTSDSSYENHIEARQQEEKGQQQELKVDESYTSNKTKSNGLQEQDGSLYEQLTEQIRQKESIQSKLASVTDELLEKDKNLKKLTDETIAKDAEHQTLLDSIDLQKADNKKSKEDLQKQSKHVELLTNELADLQLQLSEKVQENELIERKYTNAIEEVTTNENNVKKLRNEAALKDLEYKRLLDTLDNNKRKIDVQNKEIVDLTQRLASQVHDRELIQCKLESVLEELINLRNDAIAKEEERRKLLESRERLGVEKAENLKNREELAKLTEKCKKQYNEIEDLRKTLSMQITFTTIVILSGIGIIGWNYFISDA